MVSETATIQNPFKHRIALVVCYFGKLPDYAPLVFRSIAENPTIDWLIYADRMPEFTPPANVRITLCDIQQIEQRIEVACETSTRIKHYYDLTRLKPTFGLCFEEDLAGYNFWGHVDMDMIYGDLRKFVTGEILDNYDRVFSRGHLCLYRNTAEVNRFFMLEAPGAPSYKDVLANKDHRQFDEWDGIWKIFRYHRIKQYHSECIADIVPPPTPFSNTRFEMTEQPNYRHQIFYWHQGKTFQSYYHREGGLFDNEVAYVHFQKRHMPAPSFQSEKPQGFTIGPIGFTPYNRENLTPSEMDAINSSSIRPWNEIIDYWVRRIRRKVGKILQNGKKSQTSQATGHP